MKKEDAFLYSVYNPTLCNDTKAFDELHTLMHDALRDFVEKVTPQCRKIYPNNTVKIVMEIGFVNDRGQEIVSSRGCDLVMKEPTELSELLNGEKRVVWERCCSVYDDPDDDDNISEEQREKVKEWFEKSFRSIDKSNCELGPLDEIETFDNFDQLIDKIKK